MDVHIWKCECLLEPWSHGGMGAGVVEQERHRAMDMVAGQWQVGGIDVSNDRSRAGSRAIAGHSILYATLE